MTTRIALTMIANIFCMAKEWRLNSNSHQEIVYKAKLAGYQVVIGPLFPEKKNFVYQIGDYYLIPVWDHSMTFKKWGYIITDLDGLPLTDDQMTEANILLGN